MIFTTSHLIPEILSRINQEPKIFKSFLDAYIRINPGVKDFFDLYFYEHYDPEIKDQQYTPSNEPPTMAYSNIYKSIRVLKDITANSTKYTREKKIKLFVDVLESVNADEALVLESLLEPGLLSIQYPNVPIMELKAYFDALHPEKSL